jgi:hypothetical protein
MGASIIDRMAVFVKKMIGFLLLGIIAFARS